jgi:hypothetical protein
MSRPRTLLEKTGIDLVESAKDTEICMKGPIQESLREILI